MFNRTKQADQLLSKAFCRCQKEFMRGNGVASKDIAPIALRCFSTPDGEKMLAWLHSAFTCSPLGPETSDDMLRYREGQRQLIAQIERLITQAQSS